MATYSDIITSVAALQNDAPQDVYTDVACLPYLNLALKALQLKFQVYDIPVTKESSAIIEIDAGEDTLGFATTPPLPPDLVEIKQLWESPRDLNQWTPMSKRDFLPHSLENTTRASQFLIWAWVAQDIKLIPANSDNDLKLDYVRNLFIPIEIADVGDTLEIVNTEQYLIFKTAAYCSYFIGENETRATLQHGFADDALNDSMGISIKGRQSVTTRRRPFRAAFKSRVVG